MNTLTKNRLKLISIISLFGLPVFAAWMLFNNPQLLADHETKNYGELVSPAIPTQFEDYIVNADQQDIQHLKGRWVLLHLDMDGSCDAACAKSTHLLHQLNVLLSKDSSRLKRVYMDMSVNPQALVTMQLNDTELNVYRWESMQLNKLKRLIPKLVDGDMLLVDPLGNIMMRYQQNADPYGIKKDLKLLFKASQIG